MSGSRRVYSTEHGDLRRLADAAAPPASTERAGDGVVRVSRAQAGRAGRTVTVVRGLPAAELSSTLGDLKRLCGCGGTVKSGALEIQGDHRDRVAARLEALGHQVKLAGG